MKPTYTAIARVAPGPGKAGRQMLAMKAGGKKILTLKEFDPMMTELKKETVGFIQELTSLMVETTTEIQQTLDKVCCLSWQDDSYIKAMEDRRIFVGVFDSRNALLPNLIRLCEAHDNAMDYLNIDREKFDRELTNEPDGYLQAKAEYTQKRTLN